MAGIRHLIDTEAHKALFEALRAEFAAGLEIAMQSTLIPGLVMSFSGSFGGSDGKRPINPHTGKANEEFALCDGGTYQGSKASPMITTPDLRGRFILGANNARKAGTTGGGEGHAHTITVHGHTLSWGQMPTHGHEFLWASTATDRQSQLRFRFDSGSGSGASLNYKYPQDSAVISTAGSSQPHAHGAASSSASSLPPYYALAYIMKL